MSQRVREMIERGHNNKTIIERLNVKPQIVYNLRYQINKERGLGSIGKPAPKPTEGIGAPPKKRKPRKPAGTGITAPAPHPAMSAPIQREPFAITMVEPAPTVFDKVRERFRNLMRALGGRS
jgi:hypothetical protein